VGQYDFPSLDELGDRCDRASERGREIMKQNQKIRQKIADSLNRMRDRDDRARKR
jgi:hypothetical protein